MGRPPAWDIIEKVSQQKISYYQKALTDEAVWSNLTSTYDVSDIASFSADLVLSDTLFSSLSSYFVFGLSLEEIVPVNLNWGIELPSVEEFLRGVNIKLVPMTLSDLAPELVSIITRPTEIITPEVRPVAEETSISKCYFGESKYGECYVDPTAVREFLRSTLFAFLKKWFDFRTASDMVKSATETLQIPEEIASDVFNRLSKVTSAKAVCAVVDYSFVDFSYICEEDPQTGKGIISYTDYNVRVSKSEFEDLFDALAGCIVDESAVDFCRVLGEEPEERHLTMLEDYRLLRLLDIFTSNFRSRFFATALAVANYQTAEERRYPFANTRVEDYAFTRLAVADIESKVKGLVQSLVPGVDPVTLRMYINSALELLGVTSPHRWGNEMQKSMTVDEYRQYWRGKWSNAGLDPNILDRIWDSIIGLVKQYSDARLQNRLRNLSRRLSYLR